MQKDVQTKLALCGCGKLHFTYGSVTVHFDHDEFFLFAESVSRLSAMMRQTSNRSSVVSKIPSDVRMCH